jgi:two-component system response regulator YesN
MIIFDNKREKRILKDNLGGNKMHKVVIVDNEDIITQGIANCFNWCNEGFELIRQTANSKEEICYKDLEQIMNKKITYSIGVDSQMVRAIRKGDLEMAQQSIREYFKYIEVHGFNKNYLFAMLFEFVNSVLRIVLEYNDSIENVFGKEFDPYSELSSYETFHDLLFWCEQFVKKAIEYFNNRKKIPNKQFVDRAREFIEMNYSREDLNLNIIANEVHISHCYLSQIFNNVMRKGIADYITEVRIEKSKDFLKENDIKMYEIANKVGFKDPHYFSLCFKKVVGVSPTEYKETICFDI